MWLRYLDCEVNGRLDEAAELCDPAMVARENGRVAVGSPEEDRRANELISQWYPDYRREFLHGFGTDSEAACTWRITGTPGVDAPAAAQPLDVLGVSLITVKDGRITSADLFSNGDAIGDLLAEALGRDSAE